MFRFPQAADSRPAMPDRTRHLLRRAGLFGAGLILLWVALQVAPPRASEPPSNPLTETVEADDGVAVRSLSSTPRLFTFGNLLVVLLLAGGGGAAIFLRRRSRVQGGPAIPLQALGQMSLAPNQQLRLIRCGDDVLLLGVTAGQITLLKTYRPEELETAEALAPAVREASTHAASSARPAAASSSFARLLHEQVGMSLTSPKRQAS